MSTSDDELDRLAATPREYLRAEDLATLYPDKKRRIVGLLQRMPFSGLVHDPLPDSGKTDDLYLAWLYEWLLAYHQVIRAQSDDFTRACAQNRKLLDQREVVRDFFGLPRENDYR